MCIRVWPAVQLEKAGAQRLALLCLYLLFPRLPRNFDLDLRSGFDRRLGDILAFAKYSAASSPTSGDSMARFPDNNQDVVCLFKVEYVASDCNHYGTVKRSKAHHRQHLRRHRRRNFLAKFTASLEMS